MNLKELTKEAARGIISNWDAWDEIALGEHDNTDTGREYCEHMESLITEHLLPLVKEAFQRGYFSDANRDYDGIAKEFGE